MKHLLLLLLLSSLLAACGSEKNQKEDPNRIDQLMGVVFKNRTTPQHYQSEDGKHFIKLFPNGRIEVEMTYTWTLDDYREAASRQEAGNPLSTYETYILENLENANVECRFSYDGTIVRFENYGGVSVGERLLELDILEIEMGYEHDTHLYYSHETDSPEGQRLKNRMDETCQEYWDSHADFQAGYSSLYVLQYSESVLRVHPFINRPNRFHRLNRVAGRPRQ